MEWYDWTKEYQDDNVTADIPAKMQKVREKWMVCKHYFTGLMVVCLVLMLPAAFTPYPAVQGFFVYGSVASVVALAGCRIRADIRLAMYQMLLESQRNITAELRKSEAQDL